MIARVVTALVAVVVVAWLAVIERDTRIQARGLDAVRAGKVAAADRDLRRTGFLNPDTTPDLSRALLAFGRGDTARATAMLENVIRREPKNISAWGELYVVTRKNDPATARRVVAAIKRLDPLDSPSR